MPVATFPPPSLHIPIPIPTISPHLLHSPDSSPETELQQYLDNYPTASQSMDTYAYPAIPQLTTNGYYLPSTSENTSESLVSPGGMVTVYSYTPSTGQRDTCLTTYLDFSSNIQGPVRLRLVFGDVPRPTMVEANSSRSYTQTKGDWTLTAYVPSIEHVSAHMAKMRSDGRLEWPLIVQALDSTGTLLDSVVFGTFCYDGMFFLASSALQCLSPLLSYFRSFGFSFSPFFRMVFASYFYGIVHKNSPKHLAVIV